MTSRSKPVLNFCGKSTLMKELQRTVAFRCYNDVLVSRSSKSGKVLQNKVRILYFGDARNEDSIGYYAQLLKGIQSFGGMFDRDVDIPKGSETLIMKSILHCLDCTVLVSSDEFDRGINAAVLTSRAMSNRAQLSAHSIWEFGKHVEKMGKKALPLVQRSEYKDRNMPSGKTYEDYLLFLQQGIYREMNESPDDAKAVATVEDNKDDDNVSDIATELDTSGAMSDSWFLPGLIALALWGPVMPPDASDATYKAVAFFRRIRATQKKQVEVVQLLGKQTR